MVVSQSHDRGARIGQWTGIIVHHTGIGDRPIGQSSEWYAKFYKSMISWLTKKDSNYISAHYIIGRGGELAELVSPETNVAWHAGKSSYWNATKRSWEKKCNNFMIGVELVGDGNKGLFTIAQYQQLAKLCNQLKRQYPTIQLNCIVGHEMVSPGRKNDPGLFFSWDSLFNLMFEGDLK